MTLNDLSWGTPFVILSIRGGAEENACVCVCVFRGCLMSVCVCRGCLLCVSQCDVFPSPPKIHLRLIYLALSLHTSLNH